MSIKRKLLQIPQGAESLHREAALCHRGIIRKLEDLFLSWGYLPVQIPVIDFYDIYSPLLNQGLNDTVYRLIDREGDLLMLRSDITLFLAKQASIALKGNPELPARLSYADTILRHQDQEDIQKNEFFQTGVELIGKPGIEGDAEILMLLLRTLRTLKVQNAVIHIGSRKLFNAVFRDVPENETAEVLEALRNRDTDVAESACKDGGYDELTAGHLLQLFSFIGTPEEYRSLFTEMDSRGGMDGIWEKIAEPLRELDGLISVLDRLGSIGNIRIDLSEVGVQPYYTGIVFQVYVPGLDSAAASGGRYDNLLAYFGFTSPAVGFSLMLRKLESAVAELKTANDYSIVNSPGKGDFVESFQEAEKLRGQGKNVQL